MGFDPIMIALSQPQRRVIVLSDYGIDMLGLCAVALQMGGSVKETQELSSFWAAVKAAGNGALYKIGKSPLLNVTSNKLLAPSVIDTDGFLGFAIQAQMSSDALTVGYVAFNRITYSTGTERTEIGVVVNQYPYQNAEATT